MRAPTNDPLCPSLRDGIVTHASGLHSLMDGNDQLQIDSSQITAVDGGVSMASDHLFGNQESDAFFRWLVIATATEMSMGRTTVDSVFHF